jgi:hypothetical protein
LPHYGAEIRTNQEHLKEEMMAELDAHHKRMMARVDTTDLEANQEKSRDHSGAAGRP